MNRNPQLEINKKEFREIGYKLIDDIAEFISGIQTRPVTTKLSPSQLQDLLVDRDLPEHGASSANILTEATKLLFEHSLLNGHPKFYGFITSSATPIGMLGDLLAASVNPNCGAQILSPIATEIEKQTVKWLCNFIGVPNNYGGILVSGGNMANFTAFLAARTAMTPLNTKEEGISNSDHKFKVYCPQSTHTWIEKAVILFGLGTNSIRWIKTTGSNTMDEKELVRCIQEDKDNGCHPIMVIGNAGDVSTGVVDNLKSIAKICKENKLWFHIDGAYGVPAAVVPECKSMFEGIEEADSIALDPHKWLYSPLEAGCTLVKNPQHLIDTYSSHPEYYHFFETEEGGSTNYYEYGLQNSRGFRALKVWLSLQQIGRSGYEKLIREDIALAKLLYDLATKHSELEAVTHSLSITTMRFVPKDRHNGEGENYLNTLNENLVNELQSGGEVFLSNAIIQGKYCLRLCIVNFRTTEQDIHETIDVIVKAGRQVDNKLKQNGNLA